MYSPLLSVKTATLLLLSLAWASSGHAQTTLKPGYIVQTAGDTLRGQLAVLGTQRSLRQCQFQPAAASALTTYRPEQLRGYGIEGIGDYQTGLVPVTDTLTAPRFLQVLVRGTATLLVSSDDNNDPHFFMRRTPGAPPEELRLLVTRTEQNGRIYKQEIRQYQQVLLAAFAQYPELAPAIRRARFGIPDLVAVFQRYNALTGGPVQLSAAATARSRYRAGVVLGASLNGEMALKSSITSLGYYNTVLTKPNNLTGGLQFAFNSPRLSPHLWVQLGALYSQRKYSGRAATGRELTSSADSYYIVNYEAAFVQIPVVLRYEAGKGRFHPLAELGIGANFRLAENQNSFTTYYTNQREPVTRLLFQNPRGYEQSFLAGVGINSTVFGGHNSSLVVRYELGNGITPSTSITSKTRTLFVLVSYAIGNTK